jgi:protein TonB
MYYQDKHVSPVNTGTVRFNHLLIPKLMRIMEPKKNPIVDVHCYRGTLFSIGLITSIVLVLIAFQWKTKVKTTSIPRYDPSPPELVYQVPITDHVYAEQKVKPFVIPVTFVDVDLKEIVEPSDLVPEAPHTDQPVVIATPVVEIPEEVVTTNVFIIVEVMPEPENGYAGFYELLRNNMKYPRKAQYSATEGKVFVEFIVNEDGHLSELKVLKGIGAGCDEEAIRVVSLANGSRGNKEESLLR